MLENLPTITPFFWGVICTLGVIGAYKAVRASRRLIASAVALAGAAPMLATIGGFDGFRQFFGF